MFSLETAAAFSVRFARATMFDTNVQQYKKHRFAPETSVKDEMVRPAGMHDSLSL